MEDGKIEILRHESEVLKGNPLGDPVKRDVHVYLPPRYAEGPVPLPVLLAVAGFGGTGGELFNLDPFGEGLHQRLDRLIGSGDCPPVIVVAPDCFTRVGGSQYVNSSAVGRYEDYLVEEIVPFVSDRFGCGPWGVFGRSSGGYGALRLGMRHPEVFSALACHSGDANFELAYLSDWGAALTAFREAGGPEAWLTGLWSDVNRKRKPYFKPLNMLGMAACYSPNPESRTLGIDFPFDLQTGEFRPEVWERWRAADPVRMVSDHAEALRGLRLVYVECGREDEFHLQWGARALVRAMEADGVQVTFEEFDDGHFSTGYRFDVSLPLLAAALTG